MSDKYTFEGMTIPEYMRDGLEMYVTEHIEPGGFMTAVLENNLKEAVGRADCENIRVIPAYVNYLYNYAPADCWGSCEKVDAWLRQSVGVVR